MNLRNNIEDKNIEGKNIEDKNIENNNIEGKNIEDNNIEGKNIENKNMETKRKRKLTVCALMLILIIIWGIVIFGFSSMNAEESDKASSETVANLIEQALDTNNKIGATHSNSNYDEILEAAKVINPLMRKVAHFSEYFILAVLVIMFLNFAMSSKKMKPSVIYSKKDCNVNYKKNYVWIFLISLVVCALYAITDEFHQVFVSGRSGQAIDVCIDTFGALMGLVLYSTYYLAYSIGKKHTKL